MRMRIRAIRPRAGRKEGRKDGRKEGKKKAEVERGEKRGPFLNDIGHVTRVEVGARVELPLGGEFNTTIT